MENNLTTILEGLNDEQKKAVCCVDGPVLIVAGAGSGKTRVLTSRIAYIIAGGGDPSKILALTFTKKAAGEMKDRIAAMVGRRNARWISMGTFHSVFIRFLRDYAARLGYPENFTIYDQDDSVALAKTCIRELGIDDKLASYKPKTIQGRISMLKNNLMLPGMYRNDRERMQEDLRAKRPRFIEIYELYWKKARQAGVMDFDDILVNMNILLKDCPEALDEIASRFNWIMVDEYQDTNYAQYLIVRKLAQKHRNLCVVGDDSQSIYAFRGARIENIFGFKKDYPELKTFRLERNYRSTRVIVDSANALIAHNENRIPKQCYSMSDEGEKIRVIRAFTEEEEAREIASCIASRVCSDNATYNDFAVLYRKNSQSRAIEGALRTRNIPYVVYSGHAFFDRAEIKDMLAYFKLAVNTRDDESFRRIVNRPARGIGDTSLSALAACAAAHSVSLFEAASLEDTDSYGLKPAGLEKIRGFCRMMAGFASVAGSADAYDFAKRVAEESGYLPDLRADLSVEGESRKGNVEELLNGIETYIQGRHNEEFELMQEDGMVTDDVELTDASFSVVPVNDWLVNVALAATADLTEEEEARGKVSLMTMHTAKGLEFPYVIMAGMENQIFPGGEVSFGTVIVDPKEVEEERRLCYVAMTRAKKALTLSLASHRMINGKSTDTSESMFLSEIPDRYIANPRPRRSGGGISWEERLSAIGRPAGGGFGQRPSGGFGQRPSGVRPSGVAPGHSPDVRPSGVLPRRPSGAAPSGVRPSGAAQRQPVGGAAPVHRPAADFIPSPVSEIKPGCRVEHQRFGYGKVVELFGDAGGLKARIEFEDSGLKVLLLAYAKLRVC